MNAITEFDFLSSFREVQKDTYANSDAHGFQVWRDNPLHIPTKLALIMSEAAEALEAHRKNDGVSFPSELADIVIRVMDLAQGEGIDLASEILKKHEYNKGRPLMHGGKRY